MSALSYIADNLAAVRGAIEEAEQKAGRAGKTLMLAAVKYGEREQIEALLDGGVRHVGENRVQQLLEHWPLFEKHGTEVHFIGSLQTNKVKYIVDKVTMIHSVDTFRLAAEIDRRAGAHGLIMDILVEINGAREEAKSGVLPEETEALCREILALPHVRLRGFMTMGPRLENEQAYATYFNTVRQIGNDIWKNLRLSDTPLYSMGMSESFGAAILAHADIVRVGRRLFQQ